jgi:hypothetical protein
MVATGDHFEDSDGCVYRVVGTANDVVLLRLTTPEGRRVHSGEVRRVSMSTLEAEFDHCANPDAGFTPLPTIINAIQGLFWSVWRFVPR